jgi:hypothetical protein
LAFKGFFIKKNGFYLFTLCFENREALLLGDNILGGDDHLLAHLTITQAALTNWKIMGDSHEIFEKNFKIYIFVLRAVA